MNTKILFFIAIILLTINYRFLITHEQPTITDKITNISYASNKIEIQLQNHNETFVIFSKNLLDLKKEDIVTIHAKENWYKGQKQYIIEKITKVH